jgi:hypothetical protein
MKTIEYRIHTPTVLDFLKEFMVEILDIHILNRTETAKKEDFALKINEEIQKWIKASRSSLDRLRESQVDQSMTPLT